MRSALSFTRRNILGFASGVTFIVGAGVIWRAEKRGVFGGGTREALSPWTLWNDPSIKGTPMALAAAGILAANPHNTQPWALHIADDRIEVYADTKRNLGSFDPFLREMHIGLGCAIEQMQLAAGINGYAATVEAAPGSLADLRQRNGTVLAATLKLSRLSAPAEADALYDAIPKRRTNRFPYDREKPLPASARDVLADVAEDGDVKLFLFDEGKDRDDFDAAVVAATEEIVADREMIEASQRWFRETPDAIERHRDGLSYDAAGLSTFMTFAAKMLPSVSPETAHRAWLASTRDEQLPTAALTGFLAVRDRYDRAQAIAAGRAWARLQLAATSLGLATQPINQPVETADREKQLGKEAKSEARLAALTRMPEWQPTFAFRAGMPTVDAPESARRSLKEVTSA